jgi:hypothetical protein
MIRSVSSTPRVPTYRAPQAPQATVRAAVMPTARAAVEPTGGGMVSDLSSSLRGGDMVQTGANVAHLYNAGKTGLQGGRVVNNAIGGLWKSLKNLNGNGIFTGIKNLAAETLPFATRSALFEGAISVVSNGYKMAKGQIGFGEFGGRVVADSASGLAGGAGAAVAGGLALALIPFGGAMGTIVTAIAGIAGYSVAANMFRNSKIYRSVVGTVRGALGG